MPLKIGNADSQESAKSVIFVDPDQITVNPEMNSRKPDPAKVREIAVSFNKDTGRVSRGQEQAIVARRAGKDQHLEVVFGYSRHAAAILHNAAHKDTPMKLMVDVRDMTDVEAFIASVRENFFRDNPSPIEIARQQLRLMEEFGVAEEKIVEMYGKKGSDGLEWVRQTQKLLKLPESTQKYVESGELPMVAAQELLGLTEEEQAEIIANAERKGSGKIKGESVRKAVKAKKRAKGKKIGRSLKEVKDFFTSLTGPVEDKCVRKLASVLEGFCEGNVEEPQALKTFYSLGGAIETDEADERRADAEAKAKAAADKAAADAATLKEAERIKKKQEADAAREAAKAKKAKAKKKAPAKKKTAAKKKAAPKSETPEVDAAAAKASKAIAAKKKAPAKKKAVADPVAAVKAAPAATAPVTRKVVTKPVVAEPEPVADPDEPTPEPEPVAAA